MTTEIKTLQDVKSFAQHLTKIERLSFHPHDDFLDYINFKTKERFYADDEAILRNKLMDECFQVCQQENTDIYDFMYPILMESIN
jgi:hypothetical protein